MKIIFVDHIKPNCLSLQLQEQNACMCNLALSQPSSLGFTLWVSVGSADAVFCPLYPFLSSLPFHDITCLFLCSPSRWKNC